MDAPTPAPSRPSPRMPSTATRTTRSALRARSGRWSTAGAKAAMSGRRSEPLAEARDDGVGELGRRDPCSDGGLDRFGDGRLEPVEQARGDGRLVDVDGCADLRGDAAQDADEVVAVARVEDAGGGAVRGDLPRQRLRRGQRVADGLEQCTV